MIVIYIGNFNRKKTDALSKVIMRNRVNPKSASKFTPNGSHHGSVDPSAPNIVWPPGSIPKHKIYAF